MRNLIGVLLVFLALAFSAAAHPLGNFSINQFSRLEVEKSLIRTHCVLDLAEIPTFQTAQNIDADKNGTLSQEELNAYAVRIAPEFLANLKLSVDGKMLELRLLEQRAALNMGEANLPVLRFEFDFAADLPIAANVVSQVSFDNKNNAGRVGWNEIVIQRNAGISVFDANVFGSSLSNELRNYPEDLLNAPLAERAAEFSFAFGATPENAKTLQNRDGKPATPKQKDQFAALIAVEKITLPIALFGLLIAFVLGAAHALSPGHGKAVVGAYLVGSKGTPKHAAFLGLTVTVTHTLGVFALGLITLFAANYILPERIMPFLNFVSGLLVFFIGVTIFKERLFSTLGWKTEHAHHHHDHEHGEHSHTHDDGHTHLHSDAHEHGAGMHTHDGVNYHSHTPPENISWKSLLALGISGGLLPCPSALVLMLSAISLGRVGYGLILTFAFSLGLAATLTGIGLVFLYAGKFFDRPGFANNRIIKTLPVVSAFVIACIGAVMCYSSLA